VSVFACQHNLPPSYTPHLLACVECTYLHHDDIHTPSHRTCQSYAIRRKCRRARPQARTRTPAGSIDSCKPASRTTKPSPTNASEDYVIIVRPPSVYRLCNHYTPTVCLSHPYMMCFAFLHRHIHHHWLAISCVHRYHLCICIDLVTGLGVGPVGSSFTGNLHPTPCIEWMQGKRGDPGCMAKACVHPSHKCPLIAYRFRFSHPLMQSIHSFLDLTPSLSLAPFIYISIYIYIHIYIYSYIYMSIIATLHECSVV